MAEEIKGLVGIQNKNDLDQASVALGKMGDVLVSPAGRFYELARRGQLWHAMTAVAGVAPGTAIGTTGPYTLFNPSGTGKDIVVLWAGMGYVSGTLGAGFIVWAVNVNPEAAAVTGTAIVPVNAKLGMGAGVAKPLTTSTLPANPTIARVFGNLTAALATSANSPWKLEDNVDGALVISPGCAATLQGVAAAGTTPLVVYSVLYTERPATLN